MTTKIVIRFVTKFILIYTKQLNQPNVKYVVYLIKTKMFTLSRFIIILRLNKAFEPLNIRKT